MAVLVGAVVVLREPAPAPPPEVEYLPDARSLSEPTLLSLTAHDATTARAAWTATGGVTDSGFEVRWGDRTVLVHGTEYDLTDLTPDRPVTVEVRALDAHGRRSAPATATTTPRYVPVTDSFSRESLGTPRWRVIDKGEGCLGVRDGLVEIACPAVDLVSTVPIGPGSRFSITTDGPTEGELVVALTPDDHQDLLPAERLPDSVYVRLTPTGAGVESDLPTGTGTMPAGGAFTPATRGVRHRWDLDVRAGSVIVSRDGVEVAGGAFALPWRSGRMRIAARGAAGTTLFTADIPGTPVAADSRPVWVELPPITALLPVPKVNAVPAGDRVRVVVEVGGRGRVEAVRGVELDLDGTKIADLYAERAAGGRYEWTFAVAPGEHRLTARVLPADGGQPTTTDFTFTR
ncbi:hypothetical protein GCM10022243_64730 [Saccharothrix violaceirubra]